VESLSLLQTKELDEIVYTPYDSDSFPQPVDLTVGIRNPLILQLFNPVTVGHLLYFQRLERKINTNFDRPPHVC